MSSICSSFFPTTSNSSSSSFSATAAAEWAFGDIFGEEMLGIMKTSGGDNNNSCPRFAAALFCALSSTSTSLDCLESIRIHTLLACAAVEAKDRVDAFLVNEKVAALIALPNNSTTTAREETTSNSTTAITSPNADICTRLIISTFVPSSSSSSSLSYSNLTLEEGRRICENTQPTHYTTPCSNHYVREKVVYAPTLSELASSFFTSVDPSTASSPLIFDDLILSQQYCDRSAIKVKSKLHDICIDELSKFQTLHPDEAAVFQQQQDPVVVRGFQANIGNWMDGLGNSTVEQVFRTGCASKFNQSEACPGGWNFSLYSMSHHALALPNSIYFLEMKISTIAAPLNNTSNNYSLLPRLIFSYGSARESLPPPSSLVNNDTSITSNTTTTNSSNHDSDLSDFFYKNDSGLRFRMNGILKMDYVGGDGGAEHDQGIEDTYMASGSFAVDLMWNTTYTLRWELLTNSLGIKNPSRGAHIDLLILKNATAVIDWAATSLLLDTASNASKQQQQTNGPLIFTLVVVFGGAISVIAIRCMKRSGGLLDEQGRYDALNDFKARKVSMTARQIALNGSGGGGFEGFVGTSTGGGNGRREGRGVGVASDSMELRRYGLTGNNNGAGFTFLDDDDEEMDAIAVATRKF